MSDKEKEIRLKLKNNLEHYAEKCLKIRDSDGNITPFVFNRSQKHIHTLIEKQKGETSKVRALILKGRQMGCSTYTSARYYHRITHSFGYQAFILTHSLDATNNLFKMAKRFHEHTPTLVKPEVSISNTKELVFGKLDSGYKIGTAENKTVGRSSTIQLFLGSECGFWANASEHAKGILQAVPNSSGSEIILESTANGVGNYFHQMWQNAEAGISDYIAIFVPWFWDNRYKQKLPDDFVLTEDEIDLKRFYDLEDEQIYWRRQKIIDFSVQGQDGVKSFKQEYPCIVGNQRIGTNYGLIPIKDVISDYVTNNGIVKRQWCTGLKDTIELETYCGYTIQCTPDHLISNDNNEFKEASSFLDKNIILSIPKFSNKVYKFEWVSLPCIKNKLIIDEDFALFLGFFMGDGSYGGDTLSIAFNKNDISSIIIVKRLILKLFGKEMVERKLSENGCELRTGLKELKKLFLDLGIVEKKHYGIRRKISVPDVIWKSPKHIIKQFLRGLFDSDGFCGYGTAKISFFSKYEEFAKDIQLLLLGFGITSYRRKKEKIGGIDKHKYTGNEIVLRANESRLFSLEIGFVCDRKNSRMYEWLQPGKIGRSSQPILLKDKVTKISVLEKQLVYDMEMYSDTHVFDANGILVHNCNANEAFQLTGENTFISSDLAMIARKCEAEKYGPLIIGVDPARFGDDRTSIIRRQGRVAYGLQSYIKKDTMEVVGLVQRIIEAESPRYVFIDVGGLGAGIVDRLHELGHRKTVIGINAGAKPLDAKKYVNKRAEMWGLTRDWLMDLPCQIPDDDALHADLCGIKYTFDSNSRLVMEKKEEMKRRGIRSPDCADSLCLTFSYPASALADTASIDNKKAAKIMNTDRNIRIARSKLHGGLGKVW